MKSRDLDSLSHFCLQLMCFLKFWSLSLFSFSFPLFFFFFSVWTQMENLVISLYFYITWHFFSSTIHIRLLFLVFLKIWSSSCLFHNLQLRNVLLTFFQLKFYRNCFGQFPLLRIPAFGTKVSPLLASTCLTSVKNRIISSTLCLIPQRLSFVHINNPIINK